MAGGESIPIPVHGAQVETALLHRCSNATATSPSDQFCTERVNVTVGFSLQSNVSECVLLLPLL